MNMTYRIALAVLVLIVDLAIFFFPLTAVFLAYVLIFNPRWFRDFLDGMEQPGQG